MRSELLLPSVFNNVQYRVQYYYSPSYKICNTECNITTLGIPKYEKRSAVLLPTILVNVQYGVQYY